MTTYEALDYPNKKNNHLSPGWIQTDFSLYGGRKNKLLLDTD